MTAAAAGLVLSVLMATIYGAGFHLVFGGPAPRVLLYVMVSWAGFAVGHFAGDLAGITLLKLGAVHLLAASIGSWISLLITISILRLRS